MSNAILTETIEKVKQKVLLEDIMAEDGIELRQQGSELVGHHLNKHDSNSKASLHIDPMQGLYFCFNCGEGGDVITWVMLNKDMNFMQAIHNLAAKAGIELPEMDPEEQKRLNERRQEQELLHELYKVAAEEYHKQLTNEHHKILLDKWGLTAETADRFKFGYAPGGRFIFQELKVRGFDEELIKRSGLVNKGHHDHFQKRLVFPYWKNGKVAYFIARRIDGVTPDTEYEQPKYKKLPVHNENNPHISEAVSNEYFIGEDIARGAEELLITEGICDAYVAIQAGFNCISPGTLRFGKDDHPKIARLAQGTKTVYICNDNEENHSGEKGAVATAEHLEQQGITTKIVDLPKPEDVEKIDLADYLKEHTAADFQELMRQAKTLTELSIKKLERNPADKNTRKETLHRVAAVESETEREIHIDELKRITGITKEALRKEISKLKSENKNEEKKKKKKARQMYW